MLIAVAHIFLKYQRLKAHIQFSWQYDSYTFNVPAACDLRCSLSVSFLACDVNIFLIEIKQNHMDEVLFQYLNVSAGKLWLLWFVLTHSFVRIIQAEDHSGARNSLLLIIVPSFID